MEMPRQQLDGFGGEEPKDGRMVKGQGKHLAPEAPRTLSAHLTFSTPLYSDL